MRLCLLALLLAFSVSLCDAGEGRPLALGAEARISSQLSVRHIAPRAWVFVHERPFPANSLLVEMRDGTLVLCSTPYSSEATRELLDWVHARFGCRRIVAVNTHFHADGVGGNPELRRRGIPVYGSELTVRYLREQGERARQQGIEALEGRPEEQALVRAIEFVPPDHLFRSDRGLRFEFSGEAAEVSFPGPAHSPDNAVVWFPAPGILFGGCMVLGGPRPVNVADADLASWPGAIRRLQQLHPRLVVPGHGRHLAPALLPHTLDAVARYVAEH